jgi:hypothetical protein
MMNRRLWDKCLHQQNVGNCDAASMTFWATFARLALVMAGMQIFPWIV